MTSIFRQVKQNGSAQEEVFDLDDAKGVKLGDAGSYVKRIAVYTANVDAASVAANTTAEQAVAVPGVKAGDVVLAVNKPSHTAGLGIVNARVSADDQISVTFQNTTAAGVDAAAEDYTFVVATPGL